MKAIIITAAAAFTLATPALAEKSAQQIFALTNDSPAENVVHATSVGDPVAAAQKFATNNVSPAENTVNFDRARNVDLKALKQKFALTNDSPAENALR